MRIRVKQRLFLATLAQSQGSLSLPLHHDDGHHPLLLTQPAHMPLVQVGNGTMSPSIWMMTTASIRLMMPSTMS